MKQNLAFLGVALLLIFGFQTYGTWSRSGSTVYNTGLTDSIVVGGGFQRANADSAVIMDNDGYFSARIINSLFDFRLTDPDSAGTITFNRLYWTGSADTVNVDTVSGTMGVWGANGNVQAGVDSFTTTAGVDTVVLSGITASSLAFITEYTPAYSATADTVVYHVQMTTDTMFVTRIPTDPSGGVGALKSGGLFHYLVKH